MRNEPLNAFSLHQRPYQEKRSIYYLLTKEYGVIHGLAKKGIPQFVPLTLFATGKKSLKTLQQVTIADTILSLVGQQQYAALYINEITLRLLPVEDNMPVIYDQYSKTMYLLQNELSKAELKLVLRTYEQVLFSELGFAIDLIQDSHQSSIEPNSMYRFGADSGWIKVGISDGSGDPLTSRSSKLSSNLPAKPNTTVNPNNLNSIKIESANPDYLISGNEIIAMRSGINPLTLNSWSAIHRQLIDHLFDYKPLQSRILWQQFYRYQ